MRRGLALVLVVGVLAVLAVLGSAFAVLSRLERKAAAQRVLGTKAYLLARSGLEDAQARLDAGQDPDYGGEDWDGIGAALSPFEAAQELYRPGSLDRDACPVAQAMRPSFFVRMGSGEPVTVPVQDRMRGFSGRLGGSQYALKVAYGGFYVNGGDPAVPVTATTDYNLILKRMLGVLADSLGREGHPVAQADGENLITLRPATGWKSLEQVRDLALGGSQSKLDALGPYLALDAWVDRKVVVGNAPAVPAAGLVTPFWEDIKLGRSPVVNGTRAPDFERISGRIVGRAPVSLPWARHRRPALIALLAGLDGVYLDESTTAMYRVGTRKPASLTLSWALPTDDCRTVTSEILGSTGRLETWEQWNAFCDALPLTGASDLGQAKKDLLKACFNPNTDLIKFNPDRSLCKLMDKSDLRSWSAELDLSPRGGERIACVGRVLDAGGRLLASRTLSSRRTPEPRFRLTTQGELAAESLGDLGTAGDESSIRTYGSSPYITLSTGPGTAKTFGHSFLGLDPGVSLQTYPEPQTAGAPAWYDGQLKLATVETGDREYLPTPPTGTSMMFLARYDDHLDADYSGDGGSLVAIDGGGGPHAPLSPSAWDATEPGMLLPDGAWFEIPVTGLPGYAALGNMAAHRGTISFWIKPRYDAFKKANFIASKSLFNNSRYGLNPDEGFFRSACFCMAYIGSEMGYVRCPALWQESEFAGDGQERSATTPFNREWMSHRWYLLDFLWDLNHPRWDMNTEILVDRGLPAFPDDQTGSAPYSGSMSYLPAEVDFRYEDGIGGTTGYFFMGSEGWNYPGDAGGLSFGTWGNPPDSTYDEFAIYDLGTVTGSDPDAYSRTRKLALDRYVAGRYYKGNDGAWFSAPLDLGAARPTRIAWTQVVPRDLRGPGPAAGQKPERGDPGPEIPGQLDGRILLRLADASGAALTPALLRPEGEGVPRIPRAPFRLHAVFQPNLADPANTAIVDPLALDDVTVYYRPTDRSPFAGWTEGE